MNITSKFRTVAVCITLTYNASYVILSMYMTYLQTKFHIPNFSSEGTRPLGRPRHRWKDNIRIDLREIVLVSMDWLYLAQVRDQLRALLNMVMNLWVP